MNLQQSVSLETLQTVQKVKPAVKQRLTALQMARRIFRISAAAGHPFRNITPEKWAKKWLASPVFVLTEVETDRVALIRTPRNVNKVLMDMNAAASEQEPVVVDLNRNKLAAKNGFVPSVVAVDGAHRCYGAYLKGKDVMQAWVGTKALEKVRPEPLFAAADVKPNGNGNGHATKIGSAMALYAASSSTTKPYPASVVRSNSPGGSKFTKDKGVAVQKMGGVEGHADDCDCDECKEMKADGMNPNPASVTAGGPGSGPRLGQGRKSATDEEDDYEDQVSRMEEQEELDDITERNANSGKPRRKGGVKAGTPAARSSGQLEEPSPSDENGVVDPSDAGTFVSPSDQLQYEDEPQHNPPGSHGWSNEVRGKNNPMAESPGSGVGPRLTPDKGASNSELRRVQASRKKEKDCDVCGKEMKASAVKKIVASFKAAVAKGYVPKMKAKTPPGCEDAVQGLKKSKVDNPWAVANWMHDNGRC